jgi:hypothetical protein
MFIRLILSIVAILGMSACASAQQPAPVVTATPKAVHPTRDATKLNIRVRSPLTPAQVAEIKAGYMKAFPNSLIYTEQGKAGETIFAIIPK